LRYFEIALEVEKKVRNVVGGVMSSQGVVVMNAISMLWSSMDTIL